MTPLIDVVLVMLIIFMVVSPLVNALRERLLSRAPGSKIVVFDADDSAGYGRLVNALDGAKQAGAVTLGVVMPEPNANN